MVIIMDNCEDCIWWQGDSSGMQGECCANKQQDPDSVLITGRYEDCEAFLQRYLGDVFLP